MTAFLICAVVAAAGVAYLQRLAFPSAPALTRQVRSWQRDRAAATQRSTRPAPGSVPGGWAITLLAALERRRPDVMRALAQDLAVTGETREAWTLRMATVAAVCLVVPPACAPLLVVLGLRGPSVGILALTGLALSGLIVVVTRRELHRRAGRRREEFRRGFSLYLDLVVMSMEAGRGHAEALPTVAGVGTGWVFDELRAAVANARGYGITPWSALGRVGQRLGITELVDLQASIELAQDEGGRVRDSLVSRAGSMRAARAADVQARAASRTEAMRNTLVLMALLTAAYVMTARLLYLVTA